MASLIINAKEARQILAESKAHLEGTLKRISEEIKKQAREGLNWIHYHFQFNETDAFIQKVSEELTLQGYDVKVSGANCITVKW